MTFVELQDKLIRLGCNAFENDRHIGDAPVYIRIASLNARLPVQDVTIEKNADGQDCIVIVG